LTKIKSPTHKRHVSLLQYDSVEKYSKANEITVATNRQACEFFCHGQLIGEIMPELWMEDQAAHLRGTVKRKQSRRIDDSDTKSATRLDREVRAINH